MELTIKNKKRNDLLKREEITAIIKSGVTPTIQETGNIIAKNLNSNAELVAVKRVKGKFGRNEFDVEAHVYETKEALQKVEPRPKAKKEEAKEEKAEEKKEKAPQTEKKEEKAEVKKEAKEGKVE